MNIAKSLACKRLSAHGCFSIKRFKEGEIFTCNLEFDQNLNTRMKKVWLKMSHFQLFNKTFTPLVSEHALGPSGGGGQVKVLKFFLLRGRVKVCYDTGRFLTVCLLFERFH